VFTCLTHSNTSMAKAAAKTSALPATYEAAQDELEQLVARLESGDMPLEQLLAGYQRGADLLAFCRDKLQAVEDQIKVLDAEGLKAWTPQ
jgi:exodeoxyribonuclease VII small subunit